MNTNLSQLISMYPTTSAPTFRTVSLKVTTQNRTEEVTKKKVPSTNPNPTSILFTSANLEDYFGPMSHIWPPRR